MTDERLTAVELDVREIKTLCTVLTEKLIEHTQQDHTNFTEIRNDLSTINAKVDNLVITVTRLETLHEVAKTAGASAGADASKKWSTVIAAGIIGIVEAIRYFFGGS